VTALATRATTCTKLDDPFAGSRGCQYAQRRSPDRTQFELEWPGTLGSAHRRQRTCPVAATKPPGASLLAVVGHVSGVTPDRRWLGTGEPDSPEVWQMWAWCRSRSTVAVARFGR